jgi:hypothetical protein
VTSATYTAIASKAALEAYYQSMSGDGVEYQPRKSWQKVDLSQYTSTALPARFGHAMATVSGSRVLIYGGDYTSF